MISDCSGVSNHNRHKNPRKECKIVKNNQVLIILDLLELIIFHSQQLDQNEGHSSILILESQVI